MKDAFTWDGATNASAVLWASISEGSGSGGEPAFIRAYDPDTLTQLWQASVPGYPKFAADRHHGARVFAELVKRNDLEHSGIRHFVVRRLTTAKGARSGRSRSASTRPATENQATGARKKSPLGEKRSSQMWGCVGCKKYCP